MPDAPPELQFDQADFGKPGGKLAQVCASCKGALGKQYFLANDQPVCEPCSRVLSAALSGGSAPARFAGATVLGLAGGAVGAGLYFLVARITGYEIGLVALVVGLLVGAAVRRGSGGRGGWLYQALAMAITYVAIAGTYVPYIVQGFDERGEQSAEILPANIARVTVTHDQNILLNGEAITAEQLDAELKRVKEAGGAGWYHRDDMATDPPGPAADRVADAFQRNGLALINFKDGRFLERERWSDGVARSGPGKMLLAAALVLGIAVAAPFLSLPENLIGLLIIGIALYEAWKINKRARIDIKGPFQIAAPPAQ